MFWGWQHLFGAAYAEHVIDVNMTTPLFKQANFFLAKTLSETVGVEVKYKRGSTIITIRAWAGRTLFSSLDSGGLGNVVTWSERDYIFLVHDLGALNEPKAGDIIEENINGNLLSFEIASPSGVTDPPWRYIDSHRQLVRAHTKRR